MRNLLAAATIACAGLAASVCAATAMPLPASPQGQGQLAQTIAGGCGYGFHPNPWGQCVPFHNNNGYDRPRYDDQGDGGYDGGGYDAGGDGGGYRQDNGYGRHHGQDYGYQQAPVYRSGCPRGRHPGNSGRCVPNH